MRRGTVAFLVLASIGLGLSGCGMFRYEQREPWRIQAEQACLSQKQVQPSAYMSRSSPIDGPGTCGISYPFKVSALGGGAVALDKKATLGCPIIPRMDGWLNDTVQPAAQLYFGSHVVEMRSGSYACRGRNNQRGAKLSEHSFGNAVDVMAFRLADGRQITIKGGWKGSQSEQEFLREVFVGACRHFTTVLGPGSDMFHYDHFHLDLARHDPAGRRRVCRPMIKFEPRLGDGAVAQRPVPAQPAMTWRGQAAPAQRALPQMSRPPAEEADPTVGEEEAWEDEERVEPVRPPTPRPALAAPVSPPLPAWTGPTAAPARRSPLPLADSPARPMGGLLPPAEVGTGRIY
jgi:hypothetical protein